MDWKYIAITLVLAIISYVLIVQVRTKKAIKEKKAAEKAARKKKGKKPGKKKK